MRSISRFGKILLRSSFCSRTALRPDGLFGSEGPSRARKASLGSGPKGSKRAEGPFGPRVLSSIKKGTKQDPPGTRHTFLNLQIGANEIPYLADCFRFDAASTFHFEADVSFLVLAERAPFTTSMWQSVQRSCACASACTPSAGIYAPAAAATAEGCSVLAKSAK